MTATYGMFFFSGMSVLSLIVAFLLARQVIGSHMWALLIGHSMRVAVVLGLLFPVFAHGQTEQAGGGEANLTLPDLSSVDFFGMNMFVRPPERPSTLRQE